MARKSPLEKSLKTNRSLELKKVPFREFIFKIFFFLFQSDLILKNVLESKTQDFISSDILSQDFRKLGLLLNYVVVSSWFQKLSSRDTIQLFRKFNTGHMRAGSLSWQVVYTFHSFMGTMYIRYFLFLFCLNVY